MILLSQETMDAWMITVALIGWASVATCIVTSFSKMLASKQKAIRVKCWFLFILICGQGIVSHALLTRVYEGIWEYQYMMLGISMWMGGRIAMTGYDYARKLYKSGRIMARTQTRNG